MTIGEMSSDLEVITEPPQINLTFAWKIFMDGAKNSQGVKAGAVLKSLKGAILNIVLD